jgi:hypothetical protein
MRPEFWDKFDAAKNSGIMPSLSGLESQTFSADIGHNRSVVMTGWTHLREYHFGFLRLEPGTATATVTGLIPSRSYSYSVYQYANTQDAHWSGGTGTIAVNGGPATSTTTKWSTQPTKTATATANGAGELVFTFTWTSGHIALSGISISNDCANWSF